MRNDSPSRSTGGVHHARKRPGWKTRSFGRLPRTHRAPGTRGRPSSLRGFIVASITSESNGRKTIQFVGPDSKRKSIRLGKMTLKAAEGVKRWVENLVAARVANHSLDR